MTLSGICHFAALRCRRRAARLVAVGWVFRISLGICGAGICEAAEPIPPAQITALETELVQGMRGTSRIDVRRACKSVTRKASALLKASPEAPNRYAVLGIQFKGQKQLLGLENSEENIAAIFDICRQLMDAPDDYAEARFEAEMLLSERDLAAAEATVAERAKALEEIIPRYRGTPAEPRSLMIASLIATKLQMFDLEKTLFNTMRERLPGHHEIIQWRRKHAGLGKLEVMFAGTFNRADGTPLTFPHDVMGHLSIMVFWSQETPGVEEYLKQVKELEVQYPDRFDVFSFNLDELPDGGAAALRKLKLDWTVMRLPGGKEHPAFRSYAQQDPAGIFVNAYGRAMLSPTPEEKFELSGERINDERYLAQMQSLFIGEFLLTVEEPVDTTGSTDKVRPVVPTGRELDKLQAIQACFVAPPFRYRLTRKETMANYQKAERLCVAAIKAGPKAADISTVRNHRIIALLGMWNMAGEPKYLAEAVKEAKTALATELPAGADVVARFCLAKDQLRSSEAAQGESVVSGFLAECGGTNAPSSAPAPERSAHGAGQALAAAAILALDANSRDLHERYRAKLLTIPEGNDPVLWPVVTFLRDRIHTYDVLRGNTIWRHRQRERRRMRMHIINHGGDPRRDPLPAITLKTLDGGTLSLPRDTNGKLTLLVFVEPSADPDAEFPLNGEFIIKGGIAATAWQRTGFLPYACDLADKHINKDLNTVVAFLSDGAERIKAFMKTRKLTCRAAMVPGGLANPMVRRLGILSADRTPNVFLLRRDGTIAWHASGVPHVDTGAYANMLGSKVQIEVCELEHAYQALEKGDVKEAARVFGGPYLAFSPDRYGWRAPRYHGQAIAHMGAKNWAAALESIDKAIDAKKLKYFMGRRSKDPANWRKEAATVTVEKPDDILTELWAIKADVLAKLGRKEEAATVGRRSKEEANIEPPSIYKAFHERLGNCRLKIDD